MLRRTFLSAIASAPFLSSAAYASTLSVPLTYDARGRPLAAVTLNGQGPFELVIDTAAGTTLISQELITQLGLNPSGGRARVQGASGATEAEIYVIDTVEIAGLRRARHNVLPIPVDSASSADHAGVLSARIFANSRVTYDFAGNALRVDTERRRPSLENALAVDLRHGIFPFMPATIGGIAATALIDTGARRSVANAPLRNALGFAVGDPRLQEVEAIGGATAHRTPTVAASVPSTIVAEHDYGALDLAFADLPVFASFALAEAPAIIIGIDLLRRARALTLDYSSSQIALDAPA